MAEAINCGFARVALKNSKDISSRECKKQKGESSTKFKLRKKILNA